MIVRVLFFAELAEQVGQRELQLELAEGATVRTALGILGERFGAVQAARERLAVAVNLAYADARHRLVENDELALIPPVSGAEQALCGVGRAGTAGHAMPRRFSINAA